MFYNNVPPKEKPYGSMLSVPPYHTNQPQPPPPPPPHPTDRRADYERDMRDKDYRNNSPSEELQIDED